MPESLAPGVGCTIPPQFDPASLSGARGVDFVESVGVGSDGEVSLVWPPAPAPSPTLIVGHYLDQIAWISPEQGTILSKIPRSWQNAPSMRLPPKLSRRW